MQIRVIFAAVAAVAILAGCAAGNDRLRNLNSQQIAEQIVDTQTNRQDVVALLGEPNTTQQEADGTKVLEYTWVRSRPSARPSFRSIRLMNSRRPRKACAFGSMTTIAL